MHTSSMCAPFCISTNINALNNDAVIYQTDHADYSTTTTNLLA